MALLLYRLEVKFVDASEECLGANSRRLLCYHRQYCVASVELLHCSDCPSNFASPGFDQPKRVAVADPHSPLVSAGRWPKIVSGEQASADRPKWTTTLGFVWPNQATNNQLLGSLDRRVWFMAVSQNEQGLIPASLYSFLMDRDRFWKSKFIATYKSLYWRNDPLSSSLNSEARFAWDKKDRTVAPNSILLRI